MNPEERIHGIFADRRAIPLEGTGEKWLAGLLCDMRRIELRENLDLLLDVLNLVFCAFKVYDLDRHRPLSPLFVAGK